MAAPEKILLLRRLLEEKHGSAALASSGSLDTGLESLDRFHLAKGSLTEVVADSRHPGGALLLAGLLAKAVPRHRVALIDGRDAFDPIGMPEGTAFLWIRCASAPQAVKAADLVVRDGNISLAIMLLTLNPASELRRIQANIWHRLQMLAEKSGTAFLVFTPSAQIGNARMRLSVSGHFPLGAIESTRNELEPRLALSVERRRYSLEEA